MFFSRSCRTYTVTSPVIGVNCVSISNQRVDPQSEFANNSRRHIILALCVIELKKKQDTETNEFMMSQTPIDQFSEKFTVETKNKYVQLFFVSRIVLINSTL